MPTGWLGIWKPSDAADIELWVAGRTTLSKLRLQSLLEPLQLSAAWAGAAVAARTRRVGIRRFMATFGSSGRQMPQHLWLPFGPQRLCRPVCSATATRSAAG